MASTEFNVPLESDEEAELSPGEKLFMFLHSAKAHHRAVELFEVFNAELDLESILNSCRPVLADRQQEYEDTFGGVNSLIFDGERYVHVSDFSGDKVAKRRLNRCIEKLPSFASRVEEKCPVHSKKCRLLRFSYGFLVFLLLLTEDSEPHLDELPSTVAPLEDEGLDVEIAIDPSEERALIHSDIPSVVPHESSSLNINPREDDQQGDIPLSCFPSFPIVNQIDYVLLTDIMHSFNIREDYCLAAISNYCEADKDWVEEGVDSHLLVDSAVQDGQYKHGMEILKNFFDEGRTYEAQVPSREEAAATAQRLGLAEMGKFPAPHTHEDSKSTIPLWRSPLLEADENQQVFVYDDEFLGRAGGSRSSAPSSSKSTHRKDAALGHYLHNFNKRKIVIFHKEYSEDNAKFPLFAFKVLSRFCGGNEIPMNAEKVVLVAKQFALRVFGQGYGCQALRSPYYLSYVAGALAAGIKAPDTLSVYGKRELLRSQKSRAIQEATLPRIELPTDAEDPEEGGPLKRIKPSTSSNPSSPNPES